MVLRHAPREFSSGDRGLTRREFTVQSSRALAGLILLPGQDPAASTPSPVALVKNADRSAALKSLFEILGKQDFRNKDVFLKASFNSADHFPATTDLETLNSVARHLREANCNRLVLIERSGMGKTREVWEKLEVPDLARRVDLNLLALEDVPPDEWRREPLAGSHWSKGVEVPAFITRETCIVQICNLKTHRFGGHFSASLKNSVGLVSKYARRGDPYNYMYELHASPEQRSMIAEINQIYETSLVVTDASRVFIDGGPERGDLAYPEVLLASRDRVAMDALGVALLRLHGAVGPVSKGSVFEQAQIKRAAELNLGAKSPKEINILARDDSSRKLASQLYAFLEKIDEPKKP